MKNLKKALIAGTCSALLVAGSVAGTMAYLTSTTDAVVNTFTVGEVGITLDESPVDLYGNPVDGNPVYGNQYKLIPGHTYTKDPEIHIDENSENCWLFVKVDNGIDAIESTIETQMTEKGWSLVDGTTNVYSYKDIKTSGDDVAVFDTFTVNNNADVASYTSADITITALAIQADGFNTAAEAWSGNGGAWPTV